MFWSSRKGAELSVSFDNVYIHPTAEIGTGVEIGPFSYIGPNCRVGDGSRLHNNVTLLNSTILGKHNEVYPGAVLGGEPQDKKYAGEESWLIIGDHNVIRECVTLHTGTLLGGGLTKLGSGNLLMAGCHVAHDCILEDHITMANNVLLGGHVFVGRYAGIGGMTAVHHFASIGEHAFVGGMSRVSQDVPPFMLVEGIPPQVHSINRVGLSRKGITERGINALKDAHRVIYRTDLTRREALEKVDAELGDVMEVRRLIAFLRRSENSKKGRAREV